ncbi:membrane bound c2 domain protein [Diplodia corticola]|uniref:Membrane bound c2 domain protein n=1 Tax=Diplodia corticola TaxID=236234 RepID=A0A1J9S803_9PEZI|nr:membrane bound c2 domain protein [Diplodia corticola]OJD36623.1 membrane bound c2 domain protein [Diplodia corticola]
MASRQDAELKQQGAIEAAQDPNTSVSPEAAEQKVLDEGRKAGGAGAALAFNPDDSPQEKAAQARSDDGSTPQYALPSPSKAGAIEPPPVSPTAKSDASAVTAPEDEEKRWDRVGWAPRFGMPGDFEDDDADGTLADHQTLLEGALDDKFFGDWYQNAGVIVFSCFASWIIAVLGGGLGWLFIVMAFCATYYRTSIRRVRRNFRDDLNREMAKARLETDTESLEWINSFLVKFWPIYAPVLCATIVSSVDQVLSTSCPTFLESLRMKLFVLGTKPPRMEHVKTYPKAQDDIVLMDWKFSFTPNDVSDLTARQIKNKQNPKVVLEIRVGKGVVSKGLDVIVEDMAFSGIMRLKVKLQLAFPHIEKVEFCFLEKPHIDYVCKPLGGDTFGFDINFIPGLESFIQDQIHANIGPMMYAPNVFPIEIAKMLAGNPVDQAIGVLQITFHSAHGLKNPDKFSGTPDPYATVSINNREVLGRTKTVFENANPTWSETVNVIVTTLKDTLTLTVYDYNEIRKDKELGVASFALDQLEENDFFENQSLEVLANGRARGTIQADIRFFPVLEGFKNEDGTEMPPPESSTGIVKFTVEQAKELDNSKSMIGQLNPYAVLLLNGKEVHISKKLKRTNNPVWPDATKELLITDRKKAKLGLVIKDDRDLATDPIIGTYQIKLTDMLDLMEKGKDWFNLAGVKTGRAKMTLQWKPVALKGALGGGGGYIKPVGVMRLHFRGARELRNLEAMGKSDPYVRVLLSGIEKGRTVTFKNNLNPDWDEVVYVPVHTARERLILEVMDEETVGKDRSLGHIELPVEDFLKQNENGEYEVFEDKSILSQGLRTSPTSPPKGTLNYSASFYPVLNVVDPEDEDSDEARSSMDTGRPSLDSRPARTPGHTPKSSTGSAKLAERDLNRVSTNGSADLAKKLAEGEKEQEEEIERKPEAPRITLNAEELSEYESGLLVFKLVEGEFAHTDCYLEVLMDDQIFASYSSSKIRSKHTTFNEIGDAMIRELDFSRITLRLVEHLDKKGEGEEDEIIGKLQGSTLDTLRRCLYTPTVLSFRDKNGKENKVTVSLKYLPVKMKLDPSESFNNSGNLRVDVLDAADLPAADRNGYSDPYCKFVLNGKDVYKTDKQKKTLHPAWNEFFEVPVRSRTAAEFKVDVYDWDFGDKADFLGGAAIDLTVLEPFKQQEVTLGLNGKSGAIRLKMLFKPEFVMRSRQGSSTFSGTFAAPGKVIGAPVKGVGKGAVFVGGNVIKGATFVGGGVGKALGLKGRRKSRSANTGDSDDESPPPPPPVPAPNGEAAGSSSPPQINIDSAEPPTTPHQRHKSMGAASIASGFGPSPGGAETGVASIAILTAMGYPPSANVRVHLAMLNNRNQLKEIHKTKDIKSSSGTVDFDPHRETVRTQCTADTQFKITVKDHSTWGSDDELGEHVFFLDDQGSGGTEKVVKAGAGSVLLRTSFMSSDQMSNAASGSPKSIRTRGFTDCKNGTRSKQACGYDEERTAALESGGAK